MSKILLGVIAVLISICGFLYWQNSSLQSLNRAYELRDQEQKEAIERRLIRTPFRRLRKSPLEIINRLLLFFFLGSFFFSFVSIYSINLWWFFGYLASAFSCILYPPNRRALKELIAAWPNLEDLIKNRSFWRK